MIPYRGDEHDYRHLKLMGDVGRIIPLPFDSRSPDSIREAVDSADAVVNLIGLEAETTNWSFEDTHVHLAGAIAEACADAGVERLVHFSHISADLKSASRFLQTKAMGENAVRRAFPSATILKPGSIVGAEDRLLNKYGEFAKMLKWLPLVAGGEAIVRPAIVSDIAAAVVRALDERAAAGQDYYLAGQAMTRRELYEYIFQLTRYTPRFLEVPLVAMTSIGSFVEKFPNAILTREQVVRSTISETIPAGAKTFADLNLKVSTIEHTALNVLRRFRPPSVWNNPLESEADMRITVKQQ